MDFSSITFDWANMSDTYNASNTAAQNAAVAKLMVACGHSVEMNYSSRESGACLLYTSSHGGIVFAQGLDAFLTRKIACAHIRAYPAHADDAYSPLAVLHLGEHFKIGVLGIDVIAKLASVEQRVTHILHGA